MVHNRSYTSFPSKECPDYFFQTVVDNTILTFTRIGYWVVKDPNIGYLYVRIYRVLSYVYVFTSVVVKF